jgi:hypothetical protein
MNDRVQQGHPTVTVRSQRKEDIMSMPNFIQHRLNQLWTGTAGDIKRASVQKVLALALRLRLFKKPGKNWWCTMDPSVV